jgi:hypothetical protein
MNSSLIFIALALLYAIAKIILEKRFAPLDAAGNEHQISDLAYSWGCSSHDLFHLAGAKWNFSQAKIEHDFEHYLDDGHIPPVHFLTVNDILVYTLQVDTFSILFSFFQDRYPMIPTGAF